MTFAALTLLLVESEATWRSNWGLLAGAEAPPRKGGPEDPVQSEADSEVRFRQGPLPVERGQFKNLRDSL